MSGLVITNITNIKEIAMTATTAILPCSGCSTDLNINLNTGTVTGTKPSNGIQGRRHVPAHKVVGRVYFLDGEDLPMWECPLCGYSDSWWQED
jgi:hypothetical protein